MKDTKASKTEPAQAGSVQRMVGRFRPSLREVRDGVWRASIELPTVGFVSTEAHSWEEAKMSLWLVSEAVKLLASKQTKDLKHWTDDEWRSTLQTMRAVMSPNSD